ncbi:MAG: MFS transporter [Candidatus Heimdallarchaeota archaeon]|nr:MFS transporter [Candidatus Heimdallarchaeota archaeon]
MSQTSLPLVEEFVPLKGRIGVSAADGFVNLLQGIVGGGALTYYFTENRGLSYDSAAIVWIIFAFWNALNDPLYGYITDRTKSKLGRRIPYIRYGAPLIALFYIISWINYPVNASENVLFIQFLVFLFFYDTIYTAVASALYVLPFEMAVSNKARGSIFVWKILFSVIGMAFPLIIVPLFKPGPGEDLFAYQMFHVILGVFVGLVTFLSSYSTKENYYTQEENQPPFWEGLKMSLRNRAFLIFEILSFTVIYVQTALFQGLLYYVEEIEINLLPLFAALIISTVMMLIFLIRSHEKLGVKRCMQISLSGVSLGAFLLAFGGKVFTTAFFGFFFLGFGIAAGFYLLQLQFGDVMDADEVKTGLRREGFYAGINSLVTKPAISLAQAAFSWIILYYGYEKGLPQGSQSASVESGILIAWMLVPGILLLISLISLFWYPLAGPEWREEKAKLSQIHKEKERATLEKLGYAYIE